MKSYELVGYRRSIGEFNGRPYDNLVLQLIENTDYANEKLFGRDVLKVKLPYARKDDIILSDLQIGVYYDIVFDRFGNAERVSMI